MKIELLLIMICLSFYRKVSKHLDMGRGIREVPFSFVNEQKYILETVLCYYPMKYMSNTMRS